MPEEPRIAKARASNSHIRKDERRMAAAYDSARLMDIGARLCMPVPAPQAA